MSRDSLLPPRMGWVSPRYNTPSVAILVTGLLLALLVLGLPVEKLAKLASGFKIFIFSVVNLAVILLRESNARWYRPTFKSPFYPGVQVVAILGGLWLRVELGRLAGAGVIVAMLVGCLWYVLYVRGRVSRASVLHHLFGEARALRETELAEAEEDQTVQGPRVIVPIFSDQTFTGRLVRLATAFAPGALLEVLRLKEVPEQTALKSWLEEDTMMHRLARESQVIADEVGVDLELRDVVTHNAKRALLEHANATNAQWIVMRWPARRRKHYLIRQPTGWWLQHPPCDLAMFKDRGAEAWHHVLVLAEPGPYDSLVMRAASRLAGLHDGDITVLHLARHDADARTLQHVRDYHQHLMNLTTTETASLVVPTEDKFATLAEISARFDLLVLGAPVEGGLHHTFRGAFEDRVVDRAMCSVLRLKTPDPAYHHGEAMQWAPDRELVPLTLAELVETSFLQAGVRVARKEGLFKVLARGLSQADGHAAPDAVEKALWERDKRRNTALSSGVSLFAAPSPNVSKVNLGVVTLNQSVCFRGQGNRAVDVCLVVLARPGQRQNQIRIIDRLARMLLWTHFLDELRDADSAEALRKVLRRADRKLDGELSG